MALVRISNLPRADALTGAELVPIVQEGRTKAAEISLINAASVHPTILVFAFAWNNVSPRTLFSLAAGRRIHAVHVYIDTPFDGSGAGLRIGDAVDPERLVGTGQCDPTSIGIYLTAPGFLPATATDVLLTLTPGDGASQGAGSVVFSLDP